MLSFHMFFFLLFLFNISQVEASDKYKEAIKVTTEAVLKKTGLESDFYKVVRASETKSKKWFKDNGLGAVVTVASVAVPILYRKQVRFKTGNVIFTGTKDKVEGVWRLQF